MDELERLLRARNDAFNKLNFDLDEQIQECRRLSFLASHAGEIITKIDSDFERATKLTKKDISFLFVAVALQCLRQYVLGTITQRKNDQDAATDAKRDKEEHSNRKHRYYNPSLEEIITNPVPFDANRGAKGALSGGGKLGHRATAIGHDPLLGLVFGTANIATSTLTTWDMQSYHIISKEGNTGKGTAIFDTFGEKAKTELVLSKTQEKIKGDAGQKTIVATSLWKEIEHLRSDIYSTNSLPLPVVSRINPKLASKLASFGFDFGNVAKWGTQAGFSVLINFLISTIHTWFFDEKNDKDMQLYAVRTAKILSISNLIASASNVIAVGIASAIGVATENRELVKKSVNYLDVGGIIVTIYRLFSDTNFIREVKNEYLEKRWNEIIINERNFII